MARKKVVQEEIVEDTGLLEVPEVKVMEVLPVIEAASSKPDINVLAVSNLRYCKDGSVSMDVVFEHLGDISVPFVAHQYDTEVHGQCLYHEALKGTFGPIAEYERPMPTEHDLQIELDKLMPDVVLGIATEEEVSLAKALRIQIKAMS